ncbi:patatin-like phospholipase domain-containing protein [Rhizoctonia solani AG-1 IA]|uniref:Patatin-like phospholipase domain-containing protein n=1 Tax=Thanatephorus cucumeris (strain AG1-IA) TaxID=983506 RepID=L8XAX6_THACA|nr:patatin-like phospholipase domain-containing protein [Rhizoctonia solani AG-1 IA]
MDMTSSDQPSFLDSELRRDYINEDHILAFAKALESDELTTLQDDSSPSLPGTPRTIHAERIRKVSALSDFTTAGPSSSTSPGAPIPYCPMASSCKPIAYLLPNILRVLCLRMDPTVCKRPRVALGLWVQMFYFIKFLLTLIGRGKKGKLRANLRKARTYEEWKEAARVMDEYLGFEEWKQVLGNTMAGRPMLTIFLRSTKIHITTGRWSRRHVYRSLKSFRARDDARGVLGVLEVCIRANFAGIESTRIYSESYLDEVTSALAYIRETPQLSPEEKRRFFRSANKNLGASALCLSGGASFGYYHFGVVRAFLDAGQLPRVIAGTSAGGLVAALVCTRTDDELKELLVPQLADRITACEEPFRVWWRRFRVTGARFDTPQWARKVWQLPAQLRFTTNAKSLVAYQRTGRVLNISVIPFDQHSPTKLLNHLTAPDCLIWSAAVPGILNPVVLMQKTRSGAIVPWNYGSRFKDGSLSQSPNRLTRSAGKPVAHRKGKGWRGGFLLSAAEQYLKLELTKNFKVIRDLELLPRLLGQDWSGVFTQRFEGSVTIWPRTTIMDWLNILSDPDEAELERMMSVGKRVSWPKLHLIENRTRLEREIYKGRKAFRQTPIKSAAPDVDIGADAEPSTNEVLSPPPNENKQFELGEFAAGTMAGLQAKNKLLALDNGQDGEDEQLPMDSDAERGFVTGSQKFFKRPHHHHNLRDVANRLKAHENGTSLIPPSNDDRSPSPSPTSLRRRHHDPLSIQSPSPRPGHQRSPSFIERLRKSPLSALSFRSRSPAGRNTVRDDDGWSESSSSSEEEWIGGASPAVFRKGAEGAPLSMAHMMELELDSNFRLELADHTPHYTTMGKTDKAEKKSKKEKPTAVDAVDEEGDVSMAVNEAAAVEVVKEKKSKKEKDEKETIVVPVEEVCISNYWWAIADWPVAFKLHKTVKKASKGRQVKRGVKEVVKSIRKGEKGCVVLFPGPDITPIDIISHLPVMAEDASIPYIFVASKEELGQASSTKRPTSCVLVCPDAKKKKKKVEGQEGMVESKDDDYRELYDEVFAEVKVLDDDLYRAQQLGKTDTRFLPAPSPSSIAIMPSATTSKKDQKKGANAKSAPTKSAPGAVVTKSGPLVVATTAEDVPKAVGGRPDQAAFNAQQDALKKEIDSVQAQLSVVKEKIASLGKNGPANERRNELKTELDSLRSQQAGAKNSRTRILDELKALQEENQKKVRVTPAICTRYMLTRRIDQRSPGVQGKLESQVESGSMKIAEEKRALNDITQLKRSRKTVEGFQAEEEAIQANKAKIDELKKELDDPEAKAASERYDAIKKELDDIKKEQDEAYASRNKIYDERNEISGQLDELFQKKRDSNAAWREANDKYYAKIADERARKQERFRKQREEEERQKRREQAQRIREEAEIPAFQVEIEDCQTLIDLFTGKITGAAADNKVSTSKPANGLTGVPELSIRTVEADPSLGVALKKKGEEEENYFVAKKKKAPAGKPNQQQAAKEKEAPAAPKPEDRFHVSFSTLTALGTLSIPPPSSQADVERCIADLQKKRDWYLANQKRVTAEKIAKADAEIAKLEAQAGNGQVPNGNGEQPPEPTHAPAVGGAASAKVPSEVVDEKLEQVKEAEGQE